jgi:predicted alpha/beta superfamily hydrolase
MIFALLFLIFWFAIWFWLKPRFVDVTILDRVPDYTPQNRLRLVGNIEQLGNWQNHSHALNPHGLNEYKTQLRLKEGVTVLCKFSLGDWGTVQKDRNFFDVADLQFVVSRKQPLIQFVVENFAGFEPQIQKASLTGQFEYLHKFQSNVLKNERTIMIWLPPNYALRPSHRFPVLYMHDGNNLFDARTAFGGVEWGVDEAASKLIFSGLMEEIIIVGIYNTMGRMEEYTPTVSKRHGGGDGRKYLEFITQELMPVINNRFRTNTDPQKTGIMGSSLGGLISLWAGFEFPHHFGLIGAVSPSLWWDEKYMQKIFIPSKNKLNHKIWMDMGSHEGMGRDGVSYAMKDTQEMCSSLKELGYKNSEDLFYFEHQGAYHNEASWASRIHMPLLYFYGIGNPSISLEKNWENSGSVSAKIH